MEKWVGGVALKDRFTGLFNICLSQMSSVVQVCGGWDQMGFQTTLDRAGLAEWHLMRHIIENMVISTGQGMIVWPLEQFRVYSVSSMYAKLSEGATIADSC
jgi:hypothetical protein